mmetsp:Transcript_83868/g.242486  ORF Transcript_83868/g.242486 Transcript_83868/m.242486 type:complete len:241 (-) Transcript_83868:703-1425(-)
MLPHLWLVHRRSLGTRAAALSGALEHLDPRNVEITMLPKELVRLEGRVAVIDELRTTIMCHGFLILQWVHRSTAVGGRIQRSACWRPVPNLARPITAQGYVEDQVLRSHYVLCVRAFGAGTPQRVVTDEPSVPLLGLRPIIGEVDRQCIIGDPPDLDEVRGPLDHEGHWMHVPLRRALQWECVRSTTKAVRVVGHAVVVHMVHVGHGRTTGTDGRILVELTPVGLAHMKGCLRRQVVGPL